MISSFHTGNQSVDRVCVRATCPSYLSFDSVTEIVDGEEKGAAIDCLRFKPSAM